MDFDKIKNKVMDSNYSAYDIQKETGVSTSTIYDLRKGKRKFDNLTVKIIKKLDEYFKNNWKNIYNITQMRYNNKCKEDINKLGGN